MKMALPLKYNAFKAERSDHESRFNFVKVGARIPLYSTYDRLFFFWLPAKKIGLVGRKPFCKQPSANNSRDESTTEARVDSVVNGRIKDHAFAKGLF